MSRYSSTTKCLRIFFFVLNCIFWVLSLGVFAVGSWLLYVGQENEYDVITGSRSIVSGASLLVLAGGVAIVLSAVGMAGAYGMWRPLLIIYILIVSLIVIAEVAAGVLGILYRQEVNDTLEERMVNAIEDYQITGGREEVNNAVDYIQEAFECCGVNSSLDWLNFNPDVFIAGGNKPPEECLCSNETTTSKCQLFNITYTLKDASSEQEAVYYAWNKGCLDLIKEELQTVSISVTVAGISVGIIEIAGILVALCLCICVMKKNKNS